MIPFNPSGGLFQCVTQGVALALIETCELDGAVPCWDEGGRVVRPQSDSWRHKTGCGDL